MAKALQEFLSGLNLDERDARIRQLFESAIQAISQGEIQVFEQLNEILKDDYRSENPETAKKAIETIFLHLNVVGSYSHDD